MKVAINLPYTPVDGKQISFRAPCGSEDTESLVINGVRFMLVDAQGAELHNAAGHWVAGAIVSIILDVPNRAAHVQNAAPTREYIGAAPAYLYGTEDLVAGTSELAPGVLYFVYEVN